MSYKSSPGEIPSTDRLGPARPVEEGGQMKMGTPAQPFQSYMEGGPASSPLAQPQATSSVSPFDLAHGTTTLAASPDFNTVLTQAKGVQGTLGGVFNQLNTPQLKLKQAQKYVLNNKFNEANNLFQSINTKIGAGVPAQPEIPAGTGPVDKFLRLVTHGQNQLDSAIGQLAQMKETGGTINPGDFLQIQLKMNKAQTVLEFSSVVLSKAIEGMKSILNIQL